MSKTISTELYQLIKSLSKVERRYFSIWVKKHKIKNEYSLLFKRIIQELISPESKLREMKISAQLKHRLFNYIMEALGEYNQLSMKKAKLYRQMLFVEILINKSLFNKAFQMVKSIKKEAEAYEWFSVLIEVSKIESILMKKIYGNKKFFSSSFREIYFQTLTCIEKERAILEYSIKYDLCIESVMATNRDINEGDVNKEPIIINLNQNFLNLFYCFYYNNMEKRAKLFFNNQYKESFALSKENVAYIERKRKQLKDNDFAVHEYALSIHLLMIDASLTGQVDEFYSAYKKLNAIFDANNELKQRQFPLIYIALFLFIENNTNTTFNISKIISDFQKELADYNGNDIPQERMLILYFNIVCVLIKNEFFKESITWINKIENYNLKVKIRPDIFACVRLFNLIAHFELKNYSLVYSLTNSYLYRLKNKKRFFQTELAILKFIKSNTLKNKIGLIDKLPVIEQQLIELSQQPNEKIIFSNFNFLLWVEHLKFNQNPNPANEF